MQLNQNVALIEEKILLEIHYFTQDYRNKKRY